MVSHMVYDAQNKEQRKEVRRANIFLVVTVWAMLMVFVIIASIGVYALAKHQDNQMLVTLSCFFHLTCMSTGVALFLALLFIPTRGRHTIYVDFYGDHFSITAIGRFKNTVYEFDYRDVEKIYVSKISKLGIYQKYVGFFEVYFEVRKEKRDGVLCNYQKPVYRQLHPVYSLEQANEIVEYFKKNKEDV